MKLDIVQNNIPGTVISKSVEKSTGFEFIEKVFFACDGIMLTRIREVAGIDGSTLQNWVKRGWIGKTVNKKYTKNQLARILIINLLKGSMQFEEIDHLLHYLNGEIDDTGDDVISEVTLYDYICRIADEFEKKGYENLSDLQNVADMVLSDFSEPFEGAEARLKKTVMIILAAYFDSLVRETVNALYKTL